MIINGYLKTSNDSLICIKKITALTKQNRKTGDGDDAKIETMHCVLLDNGNAVTVTTEEYIELTKFLTKRI